MIHHQLDRSVRSFWMMGELLSQPALTRRYRLKNMNRCHLRILLGYENTPVLQPAQGFRLDHKMQWWQALQGEPGFQTFAQLRTVCCSFDAPFGYRDPLIPRPVKLGP